MKRDKGKTFWSQLRDTVLIVSKSFTKELSVEMAIFLFFLSIIRHLFRSHTPPTPSPSEIVVSYFKWSSRPLRFTFKHGMFTVFLWQPRVSLLPRVYSACGRSLKLRCCHAVSFNLPLLSVHLAVTPEVLV